MGIKSLQLSNTQGLIYTCSAQLTNNSYVKSNKSAQEYIFSLGYNSSTNTNCDLYYWLVEGYNPNKSDDKKYTTEILQQQTSIPLNNAFNTTSSEPTPIYPVNVTSMYSVGLYDPSSNTNNFNYVVLFVAFNDASFNSYLAYYDMIKLKWETISYYPVTDNKTYIYSSITSNLENGNNKGYSDGYTYMIQSEYNVNKMERTNCTILQVTQNVNSNGNLNTNIYTTSNACVQNWYVPTSTYYTKNDVGFQDPSNNNENLIGIYNPMIAVFTDSGSSKAIFAGVVVTDASKNEVNIIYYYLNGSGNMNLANDDVNFISTKLNLTLKQPITGICINNFYIMYTYENTYNHYTFSGDIQFRTDSIGKDALQWILYDNNCDILWTANNTDNIYCSKSSITASNYNKLTLNSSYTIKNASNYISGCGLTACNNVYASTSVNTITQTQGGKPTNQRKNVYYSQASNTAIAAIAAVQGDGTLWWVYKPGAKLVTSITSTNK